MSQLASIGIEKNIHTIRGVQVMLDSDLAPLYGVATKVFNQAIKRNNQRFPESFRFQLTEAEYAFLISQAESSVSHDALRSQIVTLNARGKHRKYLPYVFTEQGVAMLSAVLHSETAIQTSIQIINAFVSMRQFFAHNANIFNRLDMVEKRQLSQEIKTDEKFEQLFTALENKTTAPDQGIFYDGQIFDAHMFVTDLIKTAKQSIVLIDSYVDESVLILLSKKAANVSVKILTKDISKQLQLDIQKFNAQYPSITAESFNQSHDRFIIIDEKTIYHIGASIKDLGKKWFAFSKMDMSGLEMLGRVTL